MSHQPMTSPCSSTAFNAALPISTRGPSPALGSLPLAAPINGRGRRARKRLGLRRLSDAAVLSVAVAEYHCRRLLEAACGIRSANVATNFIVHHVTGSMRTPPSERRTAVSASARMNTLNAKPAWSAAFFNSSRSRSSTCTAIIRGRFRFEAIDSLCWAISVGSPQRKRGSLSFQKERALLMARRWRARPRLRHAKAKHHNQSVSPREKALSSPGVTIMEMRDGQIHEGMKDQATRRPG